MTEWLIIAYPWIKSIHIIAVISWMAGLLYLPRLFAYHQEKAFSGPKTHDLLRTMEVRLLRIITTPAMLVAWLFGLILVAIPNVVDWSMGWPWVKFCGLVILTSFHFWLARKRKDLELGACLTSVRMFRILNELPTIIMIVIVLMVVVQPF